MTAAEAISEVSLGTTLGELVADRPGRAELFERLRFDYCCGGAKSLRDACRERGLDPNTIREQILSDDAAPDVASEIEWRDWRQASLDELCEHIVEAHHLRLHRDLPQIGRRLLEALRALELDLHQHIHEENNVLLPRLRSILDSHRANAVSASADAPPRPLVKPHATRDALPACCHGWLGEQVHRAFRGAARSKEVPCRHQ